MMESATANVEAWQHLHERMEKLIVEKEFKVQEEQKRLVRFIRDQLSDFLKYDYRPNMLELAVTDSSKNGETIYHFVHHFRDEYQYYETMWSRVAEDFDEVNELLLDATAFQILRVNSKSVTFAFNRDDTWDGDTIRSRLTQQEPRHVAAGPLNP